MTTVVSPIIFRAYDIRGIVGQDLTTETADLIGRAFAAQAQAQGETDTVVACDGRLSSPELTAALIDGLRASGQNVLDLGLQSTPVLYYATKVKAIPTGIMVTGSHNPPEYNGMKMVIADKTLAADDIQQLQQRILQQDFVEGSGRLETDSIQAQYQQAVLNDIQLVKPLKIVIDCGNGSTGPIAPDLFRALGCEVIELYCDIDGRFPNHPPDPTHAENLTDLIKAVKTHQADIGLAFDGDGDRLGVVTNQGEMIAADRLLMLYAQYILAKQPASTIVYDVKCSRHLTHVIEQAQGKPVMCQTGHSLIKNRMLETKAVLAGEMSGHIFFNDRWFGFDDGLYSAARLLEILAAGDLSSHDLFQQLPQSHATPELKIAIQEDAKFTFIKSFIENAYFPEAEKITLDGLRVEFTDGWGLLRASNTSPNLVLRFEADNEAALTRIQQQFAEQINAIDAGLQLPY